MSVSANALYRAMITPAFGVRPASAWRLAAKILLRVVAVLVVLVTCAGVYFWTPDIPIEKLKTRSGDSALRLHTDGRDAGPFSR